MGIEVFDFVLVGIGQWVVVDGQMVIVQVDLVVVYGSDVFDQMDVIVW